MTTGEDGEVLREKIARANTSLRGALETCAKTFRRYGELHRAKGTTEGNLKASNNDDLAEFCEGVLADTADLLALIEPVMEENERLREAVEDIAKFARPQSYASERARAALSPKSEKQDG